METLTTFYEKHKKVIWFGITCGVMYTMGYHNGWKNFQKALVRTCKIINQEITTVKF